MNTTFDQLLQKANEAHKDELYGLAGYFTEMALRFGGRPVKAPESPTQKKRQAMKESFSRDPWGAHE